MNSRVFVRPISAVLLICGLASTAIAAYDWQQRYAKLTATGDLEWDPQPFVYAPGASVRYIDYENGSDSNNGQSKATAWRHHPWDANASGNAAAASGIHTYVFKRGVIYRGELEPDESGAAGNPIKLTSDPSWGSGEAMLYGSEQVTGWQRGGHALMPNTANVWYADLSFAPRRVFMVDGTNITRIPLARTPNWTISNEDDIKSEWWNWTDIESDDGSLFVCRDTVHLNETSDYYVGAYVWTEYQIVMATPYCQDIEEFDAGLKALKWRGHWGTMHRPWQHNRYFIEDKPQYLDSAGEFWFDKSGNGGRLYVWLPADQDPNAATIEAARYMNIFDADDVSHIEASGLSFRFNNAYWSLDARFFVHDDVVNAAFRVKGSGRGITVKNCVFEHVSCGTHLEVVDDSGYMDDVLVCDNTIRETDHGAININDSSRHGKSAPPFGELHDVNVLRNYLYRIGKRPHPAECHGHAMIIEFPATAHIAGNILDRCYGAGIFFFGGKGSGQTRNRPLGRYIIHQNRVTDPLLNCNDWGGIEVWQGGAHYVFNNISGNPGGYWHSKHYWNRHQPAGNRDFTTARFGFAYYLDGAYKNYIFNNVAWGENNDLTSPLCNSSAIQAAAGSFQSLHFNNTIYKFAVAWSGGGYKTARNVYTANLILDTSDDVYRCTYSGVSDASVDYRNFGFSRNVVHQPARDYGIFEQPGTVRGNFSAFQGALAARQVRADDLGKEVGSSPVLDATAHDFRLGASSSAIDYGRSYFIPWSLYGMIGEWNFLRDPQNASHLQDDHWYMKPYYGSRDMYYSTKRFNLTAHNVDAADFIAGPLEDWVDGALTFDGNNQYATLNASGTGDLTLDMGTNNFLIELYLKVTLNDTDTIVVSKAGAEGYALSIDERGCPRLGIKNGGTTVAARSGSVLINDGQWHHVIAEIDRNAAQGITIYVDGAVAQMAFEGAMPSTGASIDGGTFYLGRSDAGSYFSGAIDFLRLAQGTLADAKTTIGELYAWQFNGPFLKDFTGAHAQGARDAGAFEWTNRSGVPLIVKQPFDKVVEQGVDATFIVLGDDATHYQWRDNGVPMTGETNTSLAVSTTMAQLGQSGPYDVVLSNSVGSVTSDAANLVVVPEPAAAVVACVLAAVLHRRTE